MPAIAALASLRDAPSTAPVPGGIGSLNHWLIAEIPSGSVLLTLDIVRSPFQGVEIFLRIVTQAGATLVCAALGDCLAPFQGFGTDDDHSLSPKDSRMRWRMVFALERAALASSRVADSPG